MNKYVKAFLHRGMMFGGFGPIIVGIVYLILSSSVSDFSLSGGQVCLAIISSYIFAFLQAGASVFNQIDEWSLPKSLLCHFLTLYLAYVLCYIVNTWMPFEPMIILIFTLIFAALYFVIWLAVYFSIKVTSKRFNDKLR